MKSGLDNGVESGVDSEAGRPEKFQALIDRFEQQEDPIHQHMATVMKSFLPGLFVGEDVFTEISDNLDLERFFRLPKSHERKSTAITTRACTSSKTGQQRSSPWMHTRRTRPSPRTT